jgi:hypothetical protein
VPVSIKLTDVEGIVNQLAPSTFSDTWHNTVTIKIPDGMVWHGIHSHPKYREIHKEIPPHVDYQITRKAITISGSGDRVSIAAQVHAHAREEPGGITADADGNASGSSTLTVNPDYNIAPSIDIAVHINHAGVNLPILDKINMSGFANSKAKDAVNGIKGNLGQQVSKAVNLRKIAQNAWDKIPGSVLIPGTSDLWICLSPKAVMLDGPHAANDTVTGVLALQTGVETLFQSTPPSSPQTVPLPNLTSPPSDRKFHVSLPVKAQIKELNQQLSLLIKGKDQGTINLGNGYVVTLKNASLFPSGNQLFLKVAFVGNQGSWLKKVKGTLIFVATPKLDANKQILSFQNIDFTADTKSTLKGAAIEFATWLLKPILIDELQKRLVLDLTPQLAKAKSDANTLAGKIKLAAPLHLEFNLERLDTQAVAVYGDTLYVDFEASGTSKVTF